MFVVHIFVHASAVHNMVESPVFCAMLRMSIDDSESVLCMFTVTDPPN